MPKYLYECEVCTERFSAYHLMSETLKTCEKCDAKDCLKKLPLFPINVKKDKKGQKVGEVVKQHIKDAKEELKIEKKDLTTKEYEK